MRAPKGVLLSRLRPLLLGAVVLLPGCAKLQVTKVTDANAATGKGVHYYLPKPFIQVTPQADGTVAVDVVYLPDKSHEYAIDTSSTLSAFTFQVARDEKGLLTSVEYKASTAVVGQQLAASAGAIAAQSYNIKAAQLAANQAQVNTAQTAADLALANYLAAKATLASDTAHGAVAATLTSDNAAVAQAEARLQIAQHAVQRAQGTSQAVSAPVAAGTIAATTSPAMGTVFGQQTWNAPIVYNLPDKFGPVLFAVNDWKDRNGRNRVELKAVSGKIGASSSKQTVQPAFETVATALGPPTLFPPQQTAPVSVKQLVFYFDRPIKPQLLTGSVTTDATPPVATAAAPKGSNDGKSVTVDTTSLNAGNYVLAVNFSYVADSSGHTMSNVQKVKFTLTAN